MPTRKIAEPTLEPLTVAEAKAAPGMRVAHAADDAFIGTLITAARQECEAAIGCSILATTWEHVRDDFPAAIRLEWPTVRSITWVKYINAEGVQTTLDAAAYALDESTFPGYLVPAYGGAWPTPRAEANAVRVRYVAGFDSGAEGDDAARRAAVPAALRAWIQLRTEQLYNGCSADHAEQMRQHPLLAQWVNWA